MRRPEIGAPSPRTLDDVLDALEGVTPAIAEHAAAAESDGRFPDEVIDAIAEAGLFRLWIPRAYGGDELGVPDSLEVFEAASRIDGAAGWLITIGTGGGLFGAHMHPEAAAEVFTPQRALIAGSGSPSGVAVPVEGGYRVSGSWRYASGAHHATWFTANCVIEDGDASTSGATSESPTVRAMAFPPKDVEVLDTWQVTGMRATNSHDIRVHDAFVPAHRMFDVFGAPLIDSPLYRFPFGTIAQLSFAAVALGIAVHALEAFPAEASPRRQERPHVTVVVDDATTRLEVAREACYEQASAAWERVTVGNEVDEQQQEQVRLAAVDAARTSADVVEALYLEAGMAPLLLASALGRCWRDVHAVTQHASLAVR